MTRPGKASVGRPPTLPIRTAHTFYLFRGREWLWLGFGLVVAVFWPVIVNQHWLHVTNLSLVAVMGAVGLNLLTGNARLVSLGQAGFLAIGGFSAGAMFHHFGAPFWVGLFVAVALGGIAGFVVAIPSLRLKALYVAITTLALHLGVTSAFAVYLARVIRSEGVIVDPPNLGFFVLEDMAAWYYFLLIIAALIVIGALNLRRSFLGRRWVAVGDHELASEALGISVHRAKLSAFIVTSMIVSFAGCLGAYYEGVITAGYYDLHLAIAYLAMIIVGGLGSVLGSILGAFVITFLPYLLDLLIGVIGVKIAAGSLSGLHSVLYGLLIVGFMLFEPLGLAEVWRRLRDYFILWPFRYRPLEQRRQR
ncbi:MAG TPA: branched-chain amino acid ABC transporter permease [Thermohalobaculum sp.]|nr:branched-chain amino acid ABC transporter permease [Thermohalobaculum sp.]